MAELIVSPLARAEWMKFYGMLIGEEQRADSLFEVVDQSYRQLKARASAAGTGLSVLIDKMVGSVWYVPGGRSTIGQMIKDADGQYAWADDEHSGSLSLPFETVLEKAGEAQVWMFRYDSEHPITSEQLLEEKEGYSQFRAFQTGDMYGCNVATSLFYEESPFRPDWLLNDFIQILHPETSMSETLRYYSRIDP